MITKDFLYDFISAHRLAVLSTVAGNGQPQSAVVGIAVTPALEVIFETQDNTRKFINIAGNCRVSLVIGWDNETTLQYEGIATLVANDDTTSKELYYTAYPHGRQRAETWKGIVLMKVSPRWVRYSNFNEPQVINELSFPQ